MVASRSTGGRVSLSISRMPMGGPCRSVRSWGRLLGCSSTSLGTELRNGSEEHRKESQKGTGEPLLLSCNCYFRLSVSLFFLVAWRSPRCPAVAGCCFACLVSDLFLTFLLCGVSHLPSPAKGQLACSSVLWVPLSRSTVVLVGVSRPETCSNQRTQKIRILDAKLAVLASHLKNAERRE